MGKRFDSATFETVCVNKDEYSLMMQELETRRAAMKEHYDFAIEFFLQSADHSCKAPKVAPAFIASLRRFGEIDSRMDQLIRLFFGKPEGTAEGGRTIG